MKGRKCVSYIEGFEGILAKQSYVMWMGDKAFTNHIDIKPPSPTQKKERPSYKQLP
jgi:hypothetical protein